MDKSELDIWKSPESLPDWIIYDKLCPPEVRDEMADLEREFLALQPKLEGLYYRAWKAERDLSAAIDRACQFIPKDVAARADHPEDGISTLARHFAGWYSLSDAMMGPAELIDAMDKIDWPLDVPEEASGDGAPQAG